MPVSRRSRGAILNLRESRSASLPDITSPQVGPGAYQVPTSTLRLSGAAPKSCSCPAAAAKPARRASPTPAPPRPPPCAPPDRARMRPIFSLAAAQYKTGTPGVRGHHAVHGALHTCTSAAPLTAPPRAPILHLARQLQPGQYETPFQEPLRPKMAPITLSDVDDVEHLRNAAKYKARMRKAKKHQKRKVRPAAATRVATAAAAHHRDPPADRSVGNCPWRNTGSSKSGSSCLKRGAAPTLHPCAPRRKTRSPSSTQYKR